MQTYLRSTKTDKRYQVIKVDKEKKPPEVTLRGEYGDFIEPWNPDLFKKLGYVLEKVEDDD